MRQTAIISMYGLWQYNPALFDGLKLPVNVSRETVINNLLMQSIDREVLYPQPDFLAFAISAYSDMRLPVWSHLAETVNYEYDPIHNYDRTEIGSDEMGEQNQEERNRSEEEAVNGSSNSESSTKGNRSGTVNGTGSETKDSTTTETGSSTESIKTDYSRNLLENSTGSTSSTNKSVLAGGETSSNNQTVTTDETTSQEQTGKDSGQDSGQDVLTTMHGAFNLQPNMANAERNTTQFGKGTLVNHEQNSSGLLDSTVTTAGSGSIERNSTTTDTGNSSSSSELKQTGTTDETKTGNESFNKTITDKSMLNTEHNEHESEETSQTAESGTKYSDSKTNKVNENIAGQNVRKSQHNLRAYGNIGVTTTQTLIKEEREIAEFNIIEYIVNDLINHFCLLVYQEEVLWHQIWNG